jgi:hypothetical protein
MGATTPATIWIRSSCLEHGDRVIVGSEPTPRRVIKVDDDDFTITVHFDHGDPIARVHSQHVKILPR